jgi:hypothetical protein
VEVEHKLHRPETATIFQEFGNEGGVARPPEMAVLISEVS